MLSFTGFLIGQSRCLCRSVAAFAKAGYGDRGGRRAGCEPADGTAVVGRPVARAFPGLHTAEAVAIPLLLMAVAGVFVNMVLMAINLLPVPPLDGGAS